MELLLFNLLKVLPYQEMSAVSEHQQIKAFYQKCDDSLYKYQFSFRMELILSFSLFSFMFTKKQASIHCGNVFSNITNPKKCFFPLPETDVSSHIRKIINKMYVCMRWIRRTETSLPIQLLLLFIV